MYYFIIELSVIAGYKILDFSCEQTESGRVKGAELAGRMVHCRERQNLENDYGGAGLVRHL